MENLIFGLNATMPIFLVMVAGYVLHWKTTLLPDEFVEKLNAFVFQVALPVQLFKNIADADFFSVWDSGYVIFCFFAVLLSILVIWAVSYWACDSSVQAEFIEAGHRGSQVLLGAALMQGVYGENGPLPLVLIGTVPLYNAAAVFFLTLMRPGGRMDRKTLLATVKGIVRNPLIIAIAAGVLWAVLGLPKPGIVWQTMGSLAGIAVPAGLLVLGASIDLKKALGYLKLTALCSAFKLVIFAAIFLPFAVWLGYRGQYLMGILIMMASPVSVTSYSMARSMGHDGTLSSNMVAVTTVLCAFTFTVWIWLLRVLGLM